MHPTPLERFSTERSKKVEKIRGMKRMILFNKG